MQNVRYMVVGYLVLAILLVAWGQAYASEQESVVPDPCSSFLAVLDRPTVSDSACVVPQGKVVMELGFQHADLRGQGGGRADSYPQGVLRAGLPFKSEIVLLAPNYTHQKSVGRLAG